MDKYEIRKDGAAYMTWTDPRCTPDAKTLKSMKAAGYRLYVNGRPAKKLQRSV